MAQFNKIEMGPKLDWTRDHLMYDRFRDWKERIKILFTDAFEKESEKDTLQNAAEKQETFPKEAKDTKCRTLQRKMTLLQRRIFMRFKQYRKIQTRSNIGTRTETSEYRRSEKKINSMWK